MNERIIELAEQAGFGLRRDGEIYTCRLEHLPITEYLAKFAELIVKECMEVSSPNYMRTPEDSVYYVEQAIDRIAEHFGVEE